LQLDFGAVRLTGGPSSKNAPVVLQEKCAAAGRKTGRSS